MVTGKQDFEDKLVSMRHDWRCLEEDVSHLTVALSVGAKQVLEEAGAAVALQTQNMADQVGSQSVRCPCNAVLWPILLNAPESAPHPMMSLLIPC